MESQEIGEASRWVWKKAPSYIAYSNILLKKKGKRYTRGRDKTKHSKKDSLKKHSKKKIKNNKGIKEKNKKK